MPLVKPPRVLSSVKCVKKVRDKNGDVRHDLKVLFDYVRKYLKFSHFWLSDRSPRNADVRSFVRSVQVCLEQSIFIILAQIFKQSVRNKSAVSEHTQRALREHSESTQSIKIRVNTVGA